MAKVAFLMGGVSNIGGIGRVVSLITNSLLKNSKHEIYIISFLNIKSENYLWHSNIKFFNLLDDDSTVMKKGIFKAAFRLRKLVKKENLDILISCDSLYGPLGVLGTKFTSTKVVYWPHTNYFENMSHQFKNESKVISSKYSDAIVSLTKTDIPNYQKHLNKKKVFQIYNPVDPSIFESDKNYDINSNKIVSVGRLTHIKNYSGLIDVAKIISEKTIDFEWHIYGSGEEEENLQNKINSLNLNKIVILKGLSTTLYEQYNQYAMMVVTSFSEGFPMILLEAMGCNLPLVSYDIATGPNEIIKEDINGHLIEPFDMNQMAEKIVSLLENKEKRETFSNAQQHLVNNYSIEKVTKKWLDLFENLKN